MVLWFLAGATQAPTGAQAAQSAQLWTTIIWFVLIFGFMWLFLIRPQKKQQEAHRRMLAALKKGDKVVTAGGLIGEITEIEEDEIRLRIAEKVEARFIKNAISRVLKG
ncbi:MAG: preprotein translocase subunit YajC [Firmicutes bacterium]|nr:preprotein translocase subunit YajC [Bacillota bacterium]